MIRSGREFYKMSGSGNDFVIVDARTEPAGELASPDRIRAICARGTGIGADGIVFLEPAEGVDFRMTYFNSDGSRASMCGNAALCCTRLAVELGAGAGAGAGAAARGASGLSFQSDTGVLRARMRDGVPEVDLQPVAEVREEAGIPLESGERRIGFALAGVPHLVVLVHDLERVDVPGRGAALRHHPSLRQGANVNFVARRGDRWVIRTFERGVEGETLACGTGAVATAILLHVWGESGADTALETRSGRPLAVRLVRDGDRWLPSLRGEGRIVFRGALGEL